VILLMVAALWIGWVGFIASDDALYYAGAHRWATEPPFAGSDHWTTRLPLMLLFAGVLRVVGESFAAFAVTAIIPYALLVALAWRFGDAVEAGTGWLAAVLVATMPVVAGQGSTVGVDLVEGALLLGGALLLARGRGLVAGVCFGLAIICRETALLALAALGPLFLLGRPVPRRVLVEAGVGIALVLGAEALFQWSQTGDPLRRYTVAFHHDEHIDRAANKEGNLLLHPAVDPLLVLLVNDDFGLIFWVAAAALVGGAWRGAGRPLAVYAAMAGASFLLVAVLVGKLVLNPRYFLPAALLAAFVAARWLQAQPPARRATVAAGLVGTNLLLLGLGNAHPRWRMEALVAAAAANPGEPVAGDPVDVRRARVPLAYAGIANAVPLPPRSRGLVVADADAAPAGQVVARYPSPPTRVGGIVQVLGLRPLVPDALQRRLLSPSPEAVLVRTVAPPDG